MMAGKNNSTFQDISKSLTKPIFSLPEKQKIKSPIKFPINTRVHSGKDYFAYTPLRQNKSLTTLASDLKVPQSADREKSQIRSPYLVNTQILREKMKEIKAKIKKFSSSKKPDSKKLASFSKLLDLTEASTKRLLFSRGFSEIKKVFSEEIQIPKKIYFSKLKKKTFRGLVLVKELKNKWKIVYLGILIRKCFRKLKEFKGHESSFELFEAGGGSSCSSISEDLKKIADLVYFNSLKQFVGMNRWKQFVLIKKRKKSLVQLSKHNYEIRLMFKGFRNLTREVLERKKKLKEFRKVFRYDEKTGIFKKVAGQYRTVKAI